MVTYFNSIQELVVRLGLGLEFDKTKIFECPTKDEYSWNFDKIGIGWSRGLIMLYAVFPINFPIQCVILYSGNAEFMDPK